MYGITLRDFIASFYLPRRSSHRTCTIAVTALLTLAILAGCRRGTGELTGPNNTPALRRLRASLALVPAEARIVLGLDLERLRLSPLGQALAAGPLKQAALYFDAFAKGTGIHLLEEVRQIVVAVPGERQDDDRCVVIAETSRIDRARIATWLQQRHDTGPRAFLHGANRIVIAQGAWADQVAKLAGAANPGPSADDDAEIRRLCERAAHNHPLWLAAVVPASLRRRLAGDARFPDVASLARLSAFIECDDGLHAKAIAELSNRIDSASLAHRLGTYVNSAKRHPDLLAQGLAPYLEALRLVPRGPHLHADLKLTAGQANDLISHLEDLVRGARDGRRLPH